MSFYPGVQANVGFAGVQNFTPTTFAVLVSGLSLVFAAYNSFVKWKRLRHIPAPSWLAHISCLWIATTTYGGRQYWVHRDLHRKLGPLVRIGPNEILTDDPQVLKHVSSAGSKYTRSSYYQAARFNPYHDNLLSLIDSEAHRKAKMRSSAAYSGRETPGWDHAVDEQLRILINVLRERYAVSQTNGERPFLDLEHITCYFTMDVITKMTFGEEVGYLRDEKDHYEFFSTLRSLWPQMSTVADVHWARKIVFSSWFLRLFGPSATDSHGFGALMGVAERLIKDRFSAESKQQGDMLSSLMKRGFNQQECEAEGLLVLLAGTESTACAIRSALIHTITSPSVYAKLKAEIKSAEREGKVSRPVNSSEVTQLPYLQAVIYESIRIRPPLLGPVR